MRAPENPDTLTAPPRLSESEWRDLRDFIQESVGIKLSDAKRVFLVSRLLKRLRATGKHSFREYLRLVQSSKPYSGEHQNLVNAVTTNKTDFFRESDHFQVLERWLDNAEPRAREVRLHGLRVWCAAASTGEEPYSIAAVLRDKLTAAEYERVVLIASDVDTRVLECARRGVYDRAAVESVNPECRMRMFVHGSGAYRGMFRVRRELREKVQFLQQNLVFPHWKVGRSFDLVFCRNVLIYFDRATQEQVVNRLLQHTAPHGLLFLGHAESLSTLSIAAKPVAHAVYAPPDSKTAGPEIVIEHAVLSRRSGLPSRRPRPPVLPAWLANARPEVLQVGESRLAAQCWLSARLDQSFILLLYCGVRKIAVVSHIQTTCRAAIASGIRRAIGSMHDALQITEGQASPLRAKLVFLEESLVSLATSELSRKGIRVAASKVVHGAAAIWIEPHSERILLRKLTNRRCAQPE